MYPICDRHPEVVKQLRREQQEDIAKDRQPMTIYFTTSDECAECGR